MKTKDEIELLAKKEYGDYIANPFFTAAPMGYIKGYIQAQIDMEGQINFIEKYYKDIIRDLENTTRKIASG